MGSKKRDTMTAQEFIKYLQENFTLEERKTKELLVDVGGTSEPITEVVSNGSCILDIRLADNWYEFKN